MEKTYMQKYYEKIKADPEKYAKLLAARKEYFKKLKADPERYARHKASAARWNKENRALLLARANLRYQNDPEYREKVKKYNREYKAYLRGDDNGQRTDEMDS